VDYRASRLDRQNGTGEYWHAHVVADGEISSLSMCGAATTSKRESKSLHGLIEVAELSPLSWDSSEVGQRCAACTVRVDDPDSFWHKSGAVKFKHCIVCEKPGGMTAVLYYKVETDGDLTSAAAARVYIHRDCLAEGEAIAREEGLGLRWPAPIYGGFGLGPPWDAPDSAT